MKSDYINPAIIEHVLFALTPENRLACRVALKTGLRIGKNQQKLQSIRKKQLQRMTMYGIINLNENSCTKQAQTQLRKE